MRQLLIVKSNTTLNAGVTKGGKDLSSLQNGVLTIYNLFDEDYSVITTAPKTNFAIALGRPNGQAPFVISEVDLSTLRVTKAKPEKKTKFKFEFTVPTPVANTDYTIRLFKKGVVPHERNSWTVQYRTGATPCNATELATKLKAQIDVKLSDKFDITATASNAKLTLEANSAWEGMLIDGLANVTITKTLFKPAIGDKAYIENLAKFCAAGKGFNYTHSEGVDAIPGYPETVEDTQYAVYNLRFKVNRDSSRTLDMGIWQEVNIAVPSANSSVIASLDEIFFGSEANTVAEDGE
jgi:hypothetical protein